MFVTIEGLDGSGKSTVMNAITDRYPNAVTSTEPSDLKYGQMVRERLSDTESDSIIDFFLFMCDRRNHIESRIKPAVDEWRLVVSDTYADSTRAYQPVSLVGEDEPFTSSWEVKHYIELLMEPWNYEPDLTLYIDISVDTAIERSDGDEKYEDREFLTQVRRNYEALCHEKDRIVRVDGEQSKEDVATSALGKIDVAEPSRI
jgi:thymidylate kinase